jgi:hypothetical protein
VLVVFKRRYYIMPKSPKKPTQVSEEEEIARLKEYLYNNLTREQIMWMNGRDPSETLRPGDKQAARVFGAIGKYFRQGTQNKGKTGAVAKAAPSQQSSFAEKRKEEERGEFKIGKKTYNYGNVMRGEITAKNLKTTGTKALAGLEARTNNLKTTGTKAIAGFVARTKKFKTIGTKALAGLEARTNNLKTTGTKAIAGFVARTKKFKTIGTKALAGLEARTNNLKTTGTNAPARFVDKLQSQRSQQGSGQQR